MTSWEISKSDITLGHVITHTRYPDPEDNQTEQDSQQSA